MGQFSTKLSPEDKKVKEDILKIHMKKIEEKLAALPKGSGADNEQLRIFHEEVSQAVVEINRALGTGLQLRPPKDLELKLKGKPTDIHELMQIMGEVEFVGTGVMKTAAILFGVPLGASLAKKGLFPRLVSDNVFVPLITSAAFLALAAFRKI